MLATRDEFEVEEGEQDVATFLASLEWLYLTHRYSVPAQGRLLRLLALAGLAPSSWQRFSSQLIAMTPQTRRVRQVMNQAEVDAALLRQAVEEIWTFATGSAVAVREPPLCPSYLAGYGYTQAEYLADLHQVYGEPAPARYEDPWPELPPLPQRASRQLHFFHQTVAMMGMTARAIDWLVERGTHRVHENESGE
jgi:hypothetical protein